ncbi:hypothetical protein V9T40_010588 [Parthenolecanium corni]|uniref:Uncharacterized protein n=1 Tax=Parthenolecanium corni TaxID=536013 RepID=A0AAN9TH00_9HEMI
MLSFPFRLLLVSTLFFLSHQTVDDATVHVLQSWKFVDFLYPSEEARSVARQQRQYTPEHVVILDSDWYFSPDTAQKRIFVTTPNFRSGIPATLSEVTRERNGDGPLLRPFPSWDSASQTTCEGPVSVYRIHIDRCGLLWALDTGRVETFTNPRRACRPKLVIYDLKNNDRIIARYEFPDGPVNDRSNLASIAIESYQNDCRDSVAYIADPNTYGLVVFNLTEKSSYRVNHNFFHPFPHKGTITINEVSFDLMDGIIGLTLSPPTDNPRKLFFHSLASVRESWVPTTVLRNRTLIENASLARSEFFISEDVREGQSIQEVMTDDGILIYSLLPKMAIACWNSAKPFKKENQHIIYQDSENLQFISGLKLKDNKYLLITTSRLQNYINGDLHNEDVKYRMIVIDDVEQLLQGTPCKRTPNGGKMLSAKHKQPPRHGRSF